MYSRHWWTGFIQNNSIDFIIFCIFILFSILYGKGSVKSKDQGTDDELR